MDLEKLRLGRIAYQQRARFHEGGGHDQQTHAGGGGGGSDDDDDSGSLSMDAYKHVARRLVNSHF